jgi:hypothetical protein
MAMLSLSIPSASASLIYSLSGGFNDATGGTSLTLTAGSAVNDPAGVITGGTYGNLTFDMVGSTMIGTTGISGITVPLPLTITTGGDTVTFGFGPAEATIYSLNVGFTTLFYGIVDAPITSVVIGGSDVYAATLATDLSPMNPTDAGGGSLVLTYNGIDLNSAGATIPAAPSSSFTLVANTPTPPVAEPTSAILSLSGAVAILLGKLARKLRKRNFIFFDESSGP